MTLEKSIFAILITAASVVAAITWKESRGDLSRLESIIAAQQQVINAAESREHDRDAAVKDTIAKIAAIKKSTQTPEQIINALPQFLHLPQPITFNPQAAASTRAVQSGKGTTIPNGAPETDQTRTATSNLPLPASPDGSSSSQSPATQNATIPAADLKPLFDYIQDCRSCQAQLAATRADLSDEQARSAALTRERDAAINAAKGGSFWQRLKRNAKWLAIGAATGVALTRIR